ncbi:hypothetical protein ONJ23_27240, partial [Salmonella enterica subsp. enterica serovar Virginia]|nr:hypothetical protein [Salmonella enterica subsp. enterica serovar Virginia]
HALYRSCQNASSRSAYSGRRAPAGRRERDGRCDVQRGSRDCATDVVLRDAHQSLFATRLRLDDMLPIAAALDDVGYGSLECWGG